MAKKAAKKKAAKKGKAKAPKKPTARALPGFEQVRNTKLDALCESIGTLRDKKNKLIADEKEDLVEALRVMQDGNVKQYTHYGVELVRVAGDDKLRVRLVKDGGDSSDEGDTE